MELEQVTNEVETNLNGTIWMTQALLPQLAAQKEAMIVTVSSGLPISLHQGILHIQPRKQVYTCIQMRFASN
jgi:short-subunit dehydrogenase involved in D-alanine esterification of teichoic acids